jgi:hypothetical protein
MFFRVDPVLYGADKWWFEGGFPSIAAMQGLEAYIDVDTDGPGSPRDDIAFYRDPKQGARHAMNELIRWRADPFAFQPRAIPKG